jgi:UPF0271 protein
VKYDLNCDLGEGESWQRTKALMRYVTSANVACAGHAGSAKSMADCVRMARESQIRLGAHPGLWDRPHFGRRHINLSPAALEALLLHQIGALEKLARHEKIRLHHVKLHGALYHATEKHEALGKTYVKTVARWWPGLKVYALAQGKVAAWARQQGLNVWEEAFVDRAYRHDGSLLPRDEPGAVLTNPRHVKFRLKTLQTTGHILSTEGKPMRLQAQTLCVHSDTSGSVKMARIYREALDHHAG